MPPPTPDDPKALTVMERLILAYMADGLTYGQIASQEYVSRHTVKSHVCRIYKKLGASNGPHAVKIAFTSGILSLDQEDRPVRPNMRGPGAYIRSKFEVPAKQGMEVLAGGRPGTITGFKGQELRIRINGDRHSGLYHPTFQIEYPKEP